MTTAEKLEYLKSHGISFADADPYFKKGVIDPVVIADCIADGIDPELIRAL